MNNNMSNFDPYETLSFLRQMAPLHWSGESWIVTRYEDVLSLLSDKRLSANRVSPALMKYMEINKSSDLRFLENILSGWALFMDKPDHTSLRAALNRVFMPFTQENIAPGLKEKIKSVIVPLVGAGEIDLMADVAYPIHFMVLSDMFGVNQTDFERLLSLSHDLNYFIGEPSSNNGFGIAKARDVMDEIYKIYSRVYEEKLANPRDDLLSKLIEIQSGCGEEGRLETFKHYTMLFVGSESTDSQIGNSLMLLAENPEQYQMLNDDRGLFKYAIRECLRFEPPIHFIQRIVKEDFSLHGFNLERGQNVSLLVASAHRDPEAFTNPDVFDITRKEKSHLAFGAGHHACIGGAISNEISVAVLASILDEVKEIRIKTEERDWHDVQGTRRLKKLAIELI